MFIIKIELVGFKDFQEKCLHLYDKMMLISPEISSISEAIDFILNPTYASACVRKLRNVHFNEEDEAFVLIKLSGLRKEYRYFDPQSKELTLKRSLNKNLINLIEINENNLLTMEINRFHKIFYGNVNSNIKINQFISLSDYVQQIVEFTSYKPAAIVAIVDENCRKILQLAKTELFNINKQKRLLEEIQVMEYAEQQKLKIKLEELSKRTLSQNRDEAAYGISFSQLQLNSSLLMLELKKGADSCVFNISRTINAEIKKGLQTTIKRNYPRSEYLKPVLTIPEEWFHKQAENKIITKFLYDLKSKLNSSDTLVAINKLNHAEKVQYKLALRKTTTKLSEIIQRFEYKHATEISKINQLKKFHENCTQKYFKLNKYYRFEDLLSRCQQKKSELELNLFKLNLNNGLNIAYETLLKHQMNQVYLHPFFYEYFGPNVIQGMAEFDRILNDSVTTDVSIRHDYMGQLIDYIVFDNTQHEIKFQAALSSCLPIYIFQHKEYAIKMKDILEEQNARGFFSFISLDDNYPNFPDTIDIHEGIYTDITTYLRFSDDIQTNNILKSFLKNYLLYARNALYSIEDLIIITKKNLICDRTGEAHFSNGLSKISYDNQNIFTFWRSLTIMRQELCNIKKLDGIALKCNLERRIIQINDVKRKIKEIKIEQGQCIIKLINSAHELIESEDMNRIITKDLLDRLKSDFENLNFVLSNFENLIDSVDKNTVIHIRNLEKEKNLSDAKIDQMFFKYEKDIIVTLQQTTLFYNFVLNYKPNISVHNDFLKNIKEFKKNYNQNAIYEVFSKAGNLVDFINCFDVNVERCGNLTAHKSFYQDQFDDLQLVLNDFSGLDHCEIQLKQSQQQWDEKYKHGDGSKIKSNKFFKDIMRQYSIEQIQNRLSILKAHLRHNVQLKNKTNCEETIAICENANQREISSFLSTIANKRALAQLKHVVINLEKVFSLYFDNIIPLQLFITLEQNKNVLLNIDELNVDSFPLDAIQSFTWMSLKDEEPEYLQPFYDDKYITFFLYIVMQTSCIMTMTSNQLLEFQPGEEASRIFRFLDQYKDGQLIIYFD